LGLPVCLESILKKKVKRRRHPNLLSEKDISSHMGLRLFKVENNFILFPAALGHMILGFAENPRLLDVFRNKQIKIEVNFINGPKPEPYIDRLSNIVDNAPLR
jgi:hypothetical protein